MNDPAPARGLPVEAIASEIEADIIFGRMAPRRELVEDALMARFDAKRHTVRAALQLLINKRIVVKERGKSARVKDFTPLEVAEIYDMRALLQREAVRVMPLPAAAGDIAELMELHAEYVKAARAGTDQPAIHNLNDRFHTSLFALCRNKTLCDAIEFYTEVSNPIRSYGIADPQWLTRAIVEHEMMIDAARQGDRERLSTLVVEHMQPTRLRWQMLRSGKPSEKQTSDNHI